MCLLFLEGVMHQKFGFSSCCCETLNLHSSLRDQSPSVSSTYIIKRHSARMIVLDLNTQKGRTESMGVAALYITAHSLLFRKME